MRPREIVGPLILIGLGVLFLVNNLVVDFSIQRLFRDCWPLVLVVIGAAQLARVVLDGPQSRWSHLSGGIILVTLGLLFSLQQLAYISFARTWPVLLIVIGGLGVLRVLIGPALLMGRCGGTYRGGFPR